MKIGNKVFIVAVLVMLPTMAAMAQSPSKILRQAEKSLGGSKALRSIASWRQSGSIRRMRDGVTGKFRSQAAKPNLYHITFDLDGLEFESGYNGRSGWVRDSGNGLSTLTGDAGVELQTEAAFRNTLWLDAKKQKAKIVSEGTAILDGKTQNVLVFGTPKGVSIKLFFDAATGLLSREEFMSAEVPKAFDYADYRKVGSTLHPFRLTVSNGDDKYEVTLDDIKLNEQSSRAEFDFPVRSDEPLPDIRSLLSQLQENEDKVEKLLDTYSFIQKSSKRKLGKDGILRDVGSETIQLSFYKGYRISRLIEKNGRPLNEKEQKEADDEAAKRVEEIERTIAKKERNVSSGPPDRDGPRVSIAEVLRASKLINPRRERFRGRDVIVFDFEPDPSFNYKNAKSMLKFFGKTAGVMWIDEKDKQVARLEAYLFDSFNVGGGVLAKLRKGASFVLEQERVNDEIWLPSVADINLSLRVLLVKGIDVNQVIRSYDYRKFSTEVKDAKVGNPTP